MAKVINKLLPILVILAVALSSVWPMVKCLSCVADYGRDGFLINWIINTSGRNLYGLHSGHTAGLFDGSIFYPYTHVLAYSEMFFITAVWVYPAGLWMQNPANVSGLALVIGQLATMFVIYKWWKKISGNRWGAMIATTAFGLSQIRFEYQVHLQMWSMQWWLLGAWLVCEWIGEERKKDWKLFLGAGLLGLQVWESLLPVYFAGLVIVARFMGYEIRDKIKKILIAGVLFGVIAAAPLLTYWGVSREFNYQRSIRDAANNSLAADDIWREFASPGLYILLVIALWRLRTSFNSKQVRWLAPVFIISLVIALGPVLKWGTKTVKIGGRVPIPLPYAVLYYSVPGFGALRTPSRWIWVTGWAASGLIAMGISNVQFTIYNWRKNAGIIGMLLVAVAGGTGIKHVRPLPSPVSTPNVFKWLNGQPGKVMVILPMANEEREMERMVFQTVHNKKTLNGFSGFYPPALIELGKELTDNFPDERTIKELEDLNVSWVVIDKKRDMRYEIRDKIINKDKKWEDKSYAVYGL